MERRADETDKRANRIYLTDKAYHYADVMKEVRQKWVRIIDVQMSQQEMQQLEQHVEEIAEKVKKAVPWNKGSEKCNTQIWIKCKT